MTCASSIQPQIISRTTPRILNSRGNNGARRENVLAASNSTSSTHACALHPAQGLTLISHVTPFNSSIGPQLHRPVSLSLQSSHPLKSSPVSINRWMEEQKNKFLSSQACSHSFQLLLISAISFNISSNSRTSKCFCFISCLSLFLEILSDPFLSLSLLVFPFQYFLGAWFSYHELL